MGPKYCSAKQHFSPGCCCSPDKVPSPAGHSAPRDMEGHLPAEIYHYPMLCYEVFFWFFFFFFFLMKLLLFQLKLFLKQHETRSQLKWQMYGSNFPSCRRWYRQICCWYQQALSRAPVSHLECIAVSPLTCFFIALKRGTWRNSFATDGKLWFQCCSRQSAEIKEHTCFSSAGRGMTNLF